MKLSPPTRPSEPLAASGVTPPAGLRTAHVPGRRPRRSTGVSRWFALLVVLPTLLVGAYYAFVAADIYESEARFLVRSRSSGGSSGGGALDAAGGGRAAALAGALSGARPGGDEARAIVSYLESHAALTALQKRIDLVALWRVPEADAIARLWWEQPQLEWMLWYFRRRVVVDFDPETSVLKLHVHAFRAADAQALAQAVLAVSEELVNALNERSVADTLRAAQEDVRTAEQRMIAAREGMIAFREREQAFDPQAAAGGAVTTITALQSALAQARTEFTERRAFMRPDNPLLQVLQNRIAALQAQINAERQRVTSGAESLTQQVAAYERLELERALADRQLASATDSLEAARSDAIRQHVFVARVADPQLPEWPLYPRAIFNTLTIFISLAVMFGIGWLLVVSAREHAN